MLSRAALVSAALIASACAASHPPPLPTAPLATAAASPSVDATRRIVAGPVTFDVTIASTAQTFYIVDQLSE